MVHVKLVSIAVLVADSTLVAVALQLAPVTADARADPTVIAASIVTVVAALAAAIVTVINAISAANDRRQAKMARETAVTTAAVAAMKTDTLIGKAEQIHTLTNSNLSKVTASLEVALSRIEGLQNHVKLLTDAKLVEDALKTQTIASVVPVVTVGMPRVAPPVPVAEIVAQLDTIKATSEESNVILKNNLVQAEQKAVTVAADVASTAAGVAADVANTAAKVASKAAGIAAGQLDSIEKTGESTNAIVKDKQKDKPKP